MHFDCMLEKQYSTLKRGLGVIDDVLSHFFKRPLPTVATRIVVLRPDRLGDMLATVPMISAARARWPRACLEVVASSANADVLPLLSTSIDRAHTLDIGYSYESDISLTSRIVNLMRRWSEIVRLSRILSGADIVIDPTGRRRHLIAAILGQVPYVAGFDFKGGSFLLSRRVRMVRDRLYSLQMLDLIEACENIHTSSPNRPRTGPVAIHTGDGGLLSRRWNAWKDLIQALLDDGIADVVLLGGATDLQHNLGLVAATDQRRVRCANTPTLDDLAEVLGASSQLICVESGAMHLAAALDIPVVAMYAATDPALWAPLGSRHRVLRALDGGRCFRAMNCPSGACVNAITVGQVIEASRALRET